MILENIKMWKDAEFLSSFRSPDFQPSDLSRLAKAIIHSKRTTFNDSDISLLSDKVYSQSGSDSFLGIRPIDGVQEYSSNGLVSNYMKNNIFIGFKSLSAKDNALFSPAKLKDLCEGYVNLVEKDLKSYRVFRFFKQSQRLDDTGEQIGNHCATVLVIGLVGQNTTDAYTPFKDLPAASADSRFAVIDQNYTDTNSYNNFFLRGVDNSGNNVNILTNSYDPTAQISNNNRVRTSDMTTNELLNAKVSKLNF